MSLPLSGAVRKVSRLIDEAVQRTVEDFVQGAAAQEPSLTERLSTRVADRLDGQTIGGLKWRAKSFTDRGRGAQEKEFGADLAGILQVHHPDLQIEKGFLAQAKLLEWGSELSQARAVECRRQCIKMLAHSASSFLFLYSSSGVYVVPALAFSSSTSNNPYEFHPRKLSTFFELHLECFVGDPEINDIDDRLLDRLRERVVAHTELRLTGTDSNSPESD